MSDNIRLPNGRETIDVVASGYDWVCTECNHENQEQSVSMNHGWNPALDLTCQYCGANFNLGNVDHCYK